MTTASYRLHYHHTSYDTGFAFADLTSAATAATVLSTDDPLHGTWYIVRATSIGTAVIATYKDGKNPRCR